MGTLGSEYRHYKLHNMYIFFLQSPFFLNLTTNLGNAYFKAKIKQYVSNSNKCRFPNDFLQLQQQKN